MLASEICSFSPLKYFVTIPSLPNLLESQWAFLQARVRAGRAFAQQLQLVRKQPW